MNSDDLGSVETLNLTLAAFKANQAEYIQRAQHAEHAAGILMQEKLPQELLVELIAAVTGQMGKRAYDRATHQQAVLQATVIALNAALKYDDAALRSAVEHAVRSITGALSVMHSSAKT